MAIIAILIRRSCFVISENDFIANRVAANTTQPPKNLQAKKIYLVFCKLIVFSSSIHSPFT